MEPSISRLEYTSTPNLSTETTKVLSNASHPHTQVNYCCCPSTPNSLVRHVLTLPCPTYLSTPNSKSPEPFNKSTGCRCNQSTALSHPLPVGRVNILTELYALQQQCSTLAFALVQSGLASPRHQDAYALGSQMPADKDLTMPMILDHVNLSSGTSTTQPGGWEERSMGDLHLDLMYQASQNAFDPALLATNIVESEAFMVVQDTSSKDPSQLDVSAEGSCESNFHDMDIFDFDAASLESLQKGFDAHEEETASVVDTLATSLSNIGSMLPGASKARSRHSMGSSAVNRLERRHSCPSCMQTFHRRSDRDRHALVHNPDAPRHDCSFPGCDRVGRNGFLRQDKLTQHQAYKRH